MKLQRKKFNRLPAYCSILWQRSFGNKKQLTDITSFLEKNKGKNAKKMKLARIRQTPRLRNQITKIFSGGVCVCVCKNFKNASKVCLYSSLLRFLPVKKHFGGGKGPKPPGYGLGQRQKRMFTTHINKSGISKFSANTINMMWTQEKTCATEMELDQNPYLDVCILPSWKIRKITFCIYWCFFCFCYYLPQGNYKNKWS